MAQEKSKKKVELHDAFFFICPECGKTTFLKGMIQEMSEEDLTEMKSVAGIDLEDDGYFLNIPEEVACHHCKEGFDVDLEEDDIKFQ